MTERQKGSRRNGGSLFCCPELRKILKSADQRGPLQEQEKGARGEKRGEGRCPSHSVQV